jgi:beta-aspartyl-peptidase (threonine type)
MEGSLSWGAVAAVQGIRHPISVARKIMDEKPRLLVARGAERFAAENGAEVCKKEDLVAVEQRQQWKEDREVIDRPNTTDFCICKEAPLEIAG